MKSNTTPSHTGSTHETISRGQVTEKISSSSSTSCAQGKGNWATTSVLLPGTCKIQQANAPHCMTRFLHAGWEATVSGLKSQRREALAVPHVENSARSTLARGRGHFPGNDPETRLSLPNTQSPAKAPDPYPEVTDSYACESLDDCSPINDTLVGYAASEELATCRVAAGRIALSPPSTRRT